MKVFTKRLIAFAIIVGSLTSCQNSATEDLDTFGPQAVLTPEEVTSIVETMVVTYPITAVENNSTSTTINNDFDLEDYGAATRRPQITFPFDVTIDGVVITIKDIKQLKSVIKEFKGRKKPKFVFPISVVLIDGSNQEIADKDALRDYLDSLDEGVKPTFVFPLSLTVNGKVVEVSTEEQLKTFMGTPAKGRRPHLVFPLSVVLSDGSNQEIATKEEFKAYLDTLADGVKPVFVFPITVEKNGKTIVINSQDEFNDLVKKPKRGNRPEFVFPISVVLSDSSVLEIINFDALKAYHETLGKGNRPVYVFPLSIIKNGKTIVIGSQNQLDALCGR